jgi:hypothetical protein
MNSASLCNLAGRYDNPLPPQFLAPIDSLKIPAQATQPGGTGSLESIIGLLKSLKIRAQLQGLFWALNFLPARGRGGEGSRCNV